MSNVNRTKEINDLFQWSNNNSNNDNLDGETGRQNRLKTTGFKGDGVGYTNSERIHAADFNFIFHHLAKDLFNIDASITELYTFVKSNRDEINKNLATYNSFISGEYANTKNNHNSRIETLEEYKTSHTKEYSSLNKKVNDFIDTTFPTFKRDEFTTTKTNHNSRIETLETFQTEASKPNWVISKVNSNNLSLAGTVEITNSLNITGTGKIASTGSEATSITNKTYVDSKFNEAKGYSDTIKTQVENKIDTKLSNLEDPTSNKQVSNKQYVDKSISTALSNKNVIENGSKLLFKGEDVGLGALKNYNLINEDNKFKLLLEGDNKPLFSFTGQRIDSNTYLGEYLSDFVSVDDIITELEDEDGRLRTKLDEYYITTNHFGDQTLNSNLKFAPNKNITFQGNSSNKFTSIQHSSIGTEESSYIVNGQKFFGVNSQGQLSNGNLKTYIDNKIKPFNKIGFSNWYETVSSWQTYNLTINNSNGLTFNYNFNDLQRYIKENLIEIILNIQVPFYDSSYRTYYSKVQTLRFKFEPGELMNGNDPYPISDNIQSQLIMTRINTSPDNSYNYYRSLVTLNVRASYNKFSLWCTAHSLYNSQELSGSIPIKAQIVCKYWTFKEKS